MQILNLYKYTRSDGGLTVSTEAPEEGIEFETAYRLVAEEGKILTDGTTTTKCVDVNSTEGWNEIVDSEVIRKKFKYHEEDIRTRYGINLSKHFDIENNLQEILEKAYAYEVITGEVK